MFTLSTACVFLFGTFLSHSLSSVSNFAEGFQKQGFYEIGNKILLKETYNELYKSFDEFITYIESDEQFAQKMHELEKRFLSIEANKNRYCSAPPSYRDPRKHSTKRFSKIYFQFIKDHYDFLKEAQSLPKAASSFLDNMAFIDTVSKSFFADILDKLEADYPGIKAKAYGNYNELTVISKIVRYEQTERWGTTAHFDKSALSLIWDSNDEHDDSLILCTNLETPSLEEMVKPARIYSGKQEVTSTILIPGLALDKCGINLKATLHGVGPLKKEYRHAVISFLLIPDLDMTSLKSDFIDKVY